jgi:uncharacterized protein (UPF0333 family)
MVSRSLEKMMLIAVGLTAVVIVGVPVLMFAINTLGATSQYEEAQTAATEILDAIQSVDDGIVNSTSLQVSIPAGLTIGSDGSTVSIIYTYQGSSTGTWNRIYTHIVLVDPPSAAGTYTVDISIDAGAISVTFS